MSKIQTIVRVRPTLPHEPPDDGIEVDTDSSLAVVNPREPTSRFRYTFQSVHGPQATQDDIWEKDVKDLIQHVWEGLSVTIFAYGVTSSGKTHTIQGSKTEPGIIPRVVKALFAMKGETDTITMSYMEIYRDEVYDLINGGTESNKLPVREDRDGNVVVQNLIEENITSFNEFNSKFSHANKMRAVASTQLNNASSRSHAVLCLNVNQVSEDTTLTGRIRLVDLAGSENNKLTGNDPARMLESSSINKSLTTLGQVVYALNMGHTRIPYRDSKLTRILQDTLGGSSIGLLICNLAPGAKLRVDTLNTLNFASRTKEVENKPTVNETDNRPAPKPHFAAVQPSRAAPQARTAVSVRKAVTETTLVSATATLHPPSAGPSRSNSRSSSRQSLAPIIHRSGRPSSVNEAEIRAKAREDIERRVREEADRERQKLEALFESERRALMLEKERELAREREKQLERALDEEREKAKEALRQKERELEAELDRQRQKATEELWKRAQEEMEAKIAKAVEEEVAKRLEEATVAAQLNVATPSPTTGMQRSASGTSVNTHDPPPPAYDAPDSEVKKRLEALEQQYESQKADEAMNKALPTKSRKDLAKAYLNTARQCQDRGELEEALLFYRKGQVFVPENAKLQVRIQEIEVKLQKQKDGLQVSPVKKRGSSSKQKSKEPAEMDVDEVQEEDDFDIPLNRVKPTARRSRSKKPTATAPFQDQSNGDEDESDHDVEVDVLDGGNGSGKRKRAVGGKKGKMADWGSGDEENQEDWEEDDEDIFPKPQRRNRGRKAKKVKA